MGNDAFTGMPAFCHIPTRACHMSPTSISPDFSPAPMESVDGYSRSPLPFSFSASARAASSSTLFRSPVAARAAAIITYM